MGYVKTLKVLQWGLCRGKNHAYILWAISKKQESSAFKPVSINLAQYNRLIKTILISQHPKESFDSPLLQAVQAKDPDIEIILLLLESGAKDYPNGKGTTALSCAKEKSLTQIEQLLANYKRRDTSEECRDAKRRRLEKTDKS